MWVFDIGQTLDFSVVKPTIRHSYTHTHIFAYMHTHLCMWMLNLTAQTTIKYHGLHF